MIELPKSIIKFIIWWVYLAPKKLFTVAKRLTLLVNYEFSFTLNLRLLFTPIYGDYSIIGRVIGFILRIIFIVFGFLFVGTLSIVTIILPLAWYVIPLVGIYYLDIWFVPITVAAYLYLTYENLNKPDLKVEGVKKEKRYLAAFRPEAKKHLKLIKKGSIASLLKFLKTSKIKEVLVKTELVDTDFVEQAGRIKNVNYENLHKLAFDFAKKHKTRYVESEHLLLAILGCIPNADTFLSSFGLDFSTIENGVMWIVGRREYFSSLYFWQDDYVPPPMAGFGHGLLGRITTDLDAVSQDYTKMVKKGRIKNVVGRDEEIDQIAQLLSGTTKNIMLIGEPGCGKTTLVMGMAHRIMHGTEYRALQNKRIVSLEMGGLIAGTKTAGQIAEKLKKAMEDVVGSGDIILFIDEIHSLVASIDQDEGFSTIFSILEPYLSSEEIQFIGATDVENFRKFVEPIGSFAGLFEIVEIQETTPQETLEILMHEATKIERKLKSTITINSLLEIIRLAEKLVHDRVMPDKALDILNRTASSIKEKKGIVNATVVDKIVSEMTHVPVTQLSEDESEKLQHIAEEIKKEVIGQDHSINKIASALKRARVGMRDEKKPMASFLFVGTTGVGKTRTAKALSRIYFGSEDVMIRLDMSEYQSPDSIDKLIGTSDGKTKGILTEAVRSKPYTVILLDEIEKAHHQILTAFLQVLDDGRLTDSSGRTVSFVNTIIIATSNVGTKQIQTITDRGGSYEEIEKSATKFVREKFAPEFLNRFTSIVVYKTLSYESVRKIARLMLNRVEKQALEQDIKLSFTDELVEELVNRGYSPEWGARPMLRVVEEEVETSMADKIISKELKKGDSTEFGVEILN
ncbi:AAA family ATPase [Patescibacteria group bacterium]